MNREFKFRAWVKKTVDHYISDPINKAYEEFENTEPSNHFTDEWDIWYGNREHRIDELTDESLRCSKERYDISYEMKYIDFSISCQGKPIAQYRNEVIELMQYTGLKDKNGKEIYEGDIVKRHFFTDYNYCYNVSELIGEVIFEDGAFIVKNGSYITPLFMEIQECNGESIKNYEVIGNVYEQPELLESEEKIK